jgi:hypothetical protein
VSDAAAPALCQVNADGRPDEELAARAQNVGKRRVLPCWFRHDEGLRAAVVRASVLSSHVILPW